MSTSQRARYQVRVQKAVAGSFIAAAAAASIAGLTAGPASAAPVQQLSSFTVDVGASEEVRQSPTSTGATGPQVRLRAVRAELENAVALRLVTSSQAEKFYAQLERRIAAGG